MPERSLPERARTLVSLARFGTLSTHSRKLPGFPFGSVMPYAAGTDGSPIFFVSSMAMHTQNIHSNSNVSLLITEPDVSEDPLGGARVTLLGTVSKRPAADVQDRYLARHENANYWKDFTDFAYYQLEIAEVYFIGGFGVMGWISAEDYRSASPDSVQRPHSS